ncbi:MAG TPA: hypothetical protein PKY59_07635 [Pyrinomonadaceae bacterium]|nr:hypothetical protein [Pyrinomonadaceae bacterium]
MFKVFEKISSLNLPKITAIEIICGDCAGEETLPRRTELRSDGRCAVCGGRSYVPAANLCKALSQHIQNQRENKEENNYVKQLENTETTGNLNPFIN